MNARELELHNIAYAQFRGIGTRHERIRAMRRLYADLSAADHEQEYFDSVSPGRFQVTEQRSPRPSIFHRLRTLITGAPPFLPTSDRTGAPVCLFGPGGDFTTEWPNRA